MLSFVKNCVVSFDLWVRQPIDPRPMGLFRAWFGILSLVNILMLWPDMAMWLGNQGVLPPEIHQSLVSGIRINLYMFTGYDDATIELIRVFGVLGGLGLIFGVFPRVAAFLMWLTVSSFAWRNPSILHSGDNLIRIGSFFLIFARSDRAYAIKHWIHAKRFPGEPREFQKIPAWPQRILQLQLCVVYLVAGIWKAKGLPWQNGSAVGTVLQLGEFQRFPIPDFVMTPLVSQVMTYATLFLEIGFPFLIWIPRLRIPMLIAGLGLHAGLEWTLNIQLFQWTITSYYLFFMRY